MRIKSKCKCGHIGSGRSSFRASVTYFSTLKYNHDGFPPGIFPEEVPEYHYLNGSPCPDTGFSVSAKGAVVEDTGWTTDYSQWNQLWKIELWIGDQRDIAARDGVDVRKVTLFHRITCTACGVELGSEVL